MAGFGVATFSVEAVSGMQTGTQILPDPESGIEVQEVLLLLVRGESLAITPSLGTSCSRDDLLAEKFEGLPACCFAAHLCCGRKRPLQPAGCPRWGSKVHGTELKKPVAEQCVIRWWTHSLRQPRFRDTPRPDSHATHRRA